MAGFRLNYPHAGSRRDGAGAMIARAVSGLSGVITLPARYGRVEFAARPRSDKGQANELETSATVLLRWSVARYNYY
ncbi:MAG TPA: hypothetical protein VNH22_06880 [Blastocatellia bacterium]|nr:hypothetical protein [Blastocatellia bacterium]